MRELKEVENRIARLYEAVEKGLLPLDTTLQERSQKLQARRQDILDAQAELRDEREVSVNRLTPAHIAKFTRALRARLLDTASGFGKAYPNLLVDEVRLDGSERRIKGSYRALARATSRYRKKRSRMRCPAWRRSGVPTGIRTPVTAVKGRCPRPLDDRDSLDQKMGSESNF